MISGKPKRQCIIPRFSRGYTLMEIIVVIIILGIVGSLSIRFLSSITNLYDNVILRSAIVDESRIAIERFYREVKPIPRPDSLLTADVATIQWHLADGNTYQYTLSSSSLNRQVNGGSVVSLVGDINTGSSAFAYYDSTLTALTSLPLSAADRQKVREIGITLVFVKGDESHTLDQLIYLPNLRVTQ